MVYNLLWPNRPEFQGQDLNIVFQRKLDRFFFLQEQKQTMFILQDYNRKGVNKMMAGNGINDGDQYNKRYNLLTVNSY